VVAQVEQQCMEQFNSLKTTDGKKIQAKELLFYYLMVLETILQNSFPKNGVFKIRLFHMMNLNKLTILLMEFQFLL
jgi:hypothetical protein